jgi:RHS repeat-associated protein
LVVDSVSGEVVQELSYDAFGRVLSDTNPGFQPFGYAGGLYDPETGLVRLGARDYDASVGRWTTKDPILFAGGGGNLYVYAANNPIGLIDPSGMSFLGDLWLGATISFHHIVNGDPDPLVDRIAGFGDALSGGLTADIRSMMGTDNFVTAGDDYTSGMILGTIWGLMTPMLRGAGAANLYAKLPPATVLINLLRKIHGNNLKCPRPAEGYSLRDRTLGDVLKYGETTMGEKRYTKKFLEDNNASIQFEASGSKTEMHDWQHKKILEYKETHAGERPPLNKSDW